MQGAEDRRCCPPSTRPQQLFRQNKCKIHAIKKCRYTRLADCSLARRRTRTKFVAYVVTLAAVALQIGEYYRKTAPTGRSCCGILTLSQFRASATPDNLSELGLGPRLDPARRAQRRTRSRPPPVRGRVQFLPIIRLSRHWRGRAYVRSTRSPQSMPRKARPTVAPTCIATICQAV